jgi:peptidoglycan/xylan/chitin deacetylase (PgdA/CDA1 family)
LLEDRALTIRVDNGSSEPWNAPPDSRAGFHYSLWTFMRELPDEQRRLALEQICDWAGSGPAQGRCMTRDELRRAAETAGVEIGAHSVSHADLRGLAPQARLTEAAGSKQELECLIGRGVTAFAYPFGDYDVSTMTAVREAGFEVACTADPGTVCRSTDPHAVPRIAVGDWPGEELRRRIDATLQ